MLWSIMPFGLVVVFLAAVLAAGALAEKASRVSQAKLQGEKTGANSLVQGEKFAVMDDKGQCPSWGGKNSI